MRKRTNVIGKLNGVRANTQAARGANVDFVAFGVFDSDDELPGLHGNRNFRFVRALVFVWKLIHFIGVLNGMRAATQVARGANVDIVAVLVFGDFDEERPEIVAALHGNLPLVLATVGVGELMHLLGILYEGRASRHFARGANVYLVPGWVFGYVDNELSLVRLSHARLVAPTTVMKRAPKVRDGMREAAFASVPLRPPVVRVRSCSWVVAC